MLLRSRVWFFLLALGCVSAYAAEIPKWATDQVRPEMSWPDTLSGIVVNEAEEPLAQARVVLALNAQVWVVGGVYEQEVYRASTTSGRDGQYSFSSRDIPRFAHRPLSVTVRAGAKDYVSWRSWNWYGMEETKVRAKLPTLKLKKGRPLSGRCVDPNGNPIPNAVLRGFYAGRTLGSWGDPITSCDEQGKFSILAPLDGPVGFWVYADDHGPNFFRAELEDKNLEFQLDEGARVFGLARAQDGSPIENAVVEAISSNTGNLPAYSLPFRIAARTDAKGKFRLPPIAGEYRLYLTSASKHMVEGGSYESPQRSRLSLPVQLKIDAGNRQNLILRESETAVVSGTVSWDNGEPAGGSMVRIAQMPKGNGSGFSLAQTVSDKNGRYRIRGPVPIERLVVYVESRRRDGQGVRAFATDSKESEFRNFERVDGDTVVDFAFEAPKKQ